MVLKIPPVHPLIARDRSAVGTDADLDDIWIRHYSRMLHVVFADKPDLL